MNNNHAKKAEKEWMSLKKEATVFPIYSMRKAWDVLEKEINYLGNSKENLEVRKNYLGNSNEKFKKKYRNITQVYFLCEDAINHLTSGIFGFPD